MPRLSLPSNLRLDPYVQDEKMAMLRKMLKVDMPPRPNQASRGGKRLGAWLVLAVAGIASAVLFKRRAA